MKTPYPGYDVLDKWESPSFDTITRGVLSRRLHAVPQRRFLTEDEFRLLEALCARLIPQPDRVPPLPIAPWIDADLADNRDEGYRPFGALPLQAAWRAGLAGVEATTVRRDRRAFADLEAETQDATLKAIQAGAVDPADWAGVDPKRFFTDHLLKAAVATYYAHPAAWSEIGYGGPASPRGYVRLGLDERDPWEARAAPDSDSRRR